MDFIDDALCIIDETFHTGCGHVITSLKHRDDCVHRNRNPYLDGYRLGFMCGVYHFNEATIARGLCKQCLTPHVNLNGIEPNQFRSDMGAANPNPSRPEIRARIAYWEQYTALQRRLSARQNVFEDSAVAFYKRLNVLLDEKDDRDEAEAPATPAEERLLRLCNGADQKRAWYLAWQNTELSEIRMMIPEIDRRKFWDEADANPEVLAPVRRADIPDGEICAICRCDLDDPQAPDASSLRRVFCGHHIFHLDCIVPWFRSGDGEHVSCPACREKRHLIREPVHLWNNEMLEAAMLEE